MFSIWQRARWMFLALAVALVGLTPATTASAQDATIELDIFKAGFIIGGGGGHGVLYYKGHGYPLKIGGISLGATIGASKAEYAIFAAKPHDPDLSGDVLWLES